MSDSILNRDENVAAEAKEIARLVVDELAPEQLDIFDDAWTAWIENPEVNRSRGLGFDIGDVQSFITAEVFHVVSFLMNVLAGMGASYLYDFLRTWRSGAKLDPGTSQEVLGKLFEELDKASINLEPEASEKIKKLLQKILGDGASKHGE